MLKANICAFLAVSLLASCSWISNSAQSKAESVLKNLLKDPSSAQYEDVDQKGDVVCGFVNSKNALGAYTGFAPFYIENGVAVLRDGPDGAFFKKFVAVCSDSQSKRLGEMSSQEVQDYLRKNNAPNR